MAVYALTDDLEPDLESLAAVAPGRTVVLGWTCGCPPSARARELAGSAGARVIEDRTQALLDHDEVRGDGAVLDVEGWTGSLDGGGAVSRVTLEPPRWAEPDRERLAERARARALGAASPSAAARDHTGPSDRAVPPSDAPHAAPRPISRAGAREALWVFDAPAARVRMEAAAARYMAAEGRRSPFTYWPPGTVAHGFPFVLADPELRSALEAALPGALTRPLVAARPEAAARAEALLALPCHAGTTATHVGAVLAALDSVTA